MFQVLDLVLVRKYAIVFGQHFPSSTCFVSLVPKEEDGACDENGRKGAVNSDNEDEGEIIDYPAEDPKETAARSVVTLVMMDREKRG